MRQFELKMKGEKNPGNAGFETAASITGGRRVHI
jgi:hypothetical protein